MRRTILLAAAVALVLATVGTPAAAVPKFYPEWPTNCDMDGPPGDLEGDRETHLVLVTGPAAAAWIVEPEPLHAAVLWLGGTVSVYDNGVLRDGYPMDVPPPPGLFDRMVDCDSYTQFENRSGVLIRVEWDPVYLFFPPPATP